MPELPEVEFCGRALARWTAGRRVVGVALHDPRVVRASTNARPTAGRPDAEEALRAVVLGRSPRPPVRHGKRLLWRFGPGALVLHLGMAGRWTRRPSPFVRVTLELDSGDRVHYADPRLLGGLVPVPSADGEARLRDGLGPDAWLDPFPRLSGRLAIKVALLDQARVAGLGNLHAAEALWRAGVHPATPTDALDDAAHARLAAGVREQLAFALALDDGHDEIAYVEDAGATNPFPLYQRGGEPCPRCGAAISRLVQAGRSTWWCPGCQPDPARAG